MRNVLFDSDALNTAQPVPSSAIAYRYDSGLELAINVALATGRPLLLRGAPGSGKTTLAADIARLMGRRYEVAVITSHTQAQDLLWTLDAVRRLADANGDDESKRRARRVSEYVVPEIIWRAFDPAGAGVTDGSRNVVVLLDEIDKADPDVPNDLLMMLDQRWFRVTDLPDATVELSNDVSALLIVTTNGERELPEAFVRRCVTHAMLEPDKESLAEIAGRHFAALSPTLFDAVYAIFADLHKAARAGNVRSPSTAELLDALRACLVLGVEPSSKVWATVCQAAMWKHPAPPKRPAA